MLYGICFLAGICIQLVKEGDAPLQELQILLYRALPPFRFGRELSVVVFLVIQSFDIYGGLFSHCCHKAVR